MTTNDITMLPSGGNPTMSSLEIAELTGKAHKNVVRDIRVMLNGLKSEPVGFQGSYLDAKGEVRECFNLPKRESLILVSGYNVELRAKIIDRWAELEIRVRSAPALDLRDPAQLSAIALQLIGVNKELTERAEIAEAKVEEGRPKADFFDQFVNSDGLYGLQNAGRALSLHVNKFIAWLKQDYLFYQGAALVPRTRFVQQGVFEIKSTLVDDKPRPRAFITPKGLAYFASRAPEHLRVGPGGLV